MFSQKSQRGRLQEGMISKPEGDAYFNKQLEFEKQMLAEILLDLYESKLKRESCGLDAEHEGPTIRERL